MLSPRRLLLILTAAVLMIAWAVTATVVIGDRERIYRSASAELIGAIPVLRMHARRSFDTTHAILVALDEALQVEGAAVALPRLGGLARRMQTDDGDPIGIAVIDIRERLTRLGSSDVDVDVSDRDYVRAIRNQAPGFLFVGRTLPSRISGRAVIPVVMKLRPNASGISAILAAVPVSNFEYVYRDLLVSAPSTIGLVRDDGMVLHLTPDPLQRVGKPMPGFDLASLNRHPQMLVFDQDISAELTQSIKAAYATIDPYPVSVVAAMPVDALQAAWRQQATPKIAIALLGSLAIGLLTAWLLVQMARRDAALRQVTQALVELDAANRAKRDFMARMSHELRTPLNAILGFSDMIAGAMLGPLPHAYQEYGRDINRSGAHLLGMINQVLDISRIEAERLLPKSEPIDVGGLTGEVVAILRPMAELHGVDLHVDIASDLDSLQADPMMLRQMLLNLMSNAVKHSPEGGTVQVRAFREAGNVLMQVTDRGPGIAKEKLDHVFEPFGSGHSMLSQQASGIGLGLPITKKLIELHGGRLSIKTSPQNGTTVTLEFPAERRIAA
ncbi:MAG: ATP-binding protein [Ferrovibrio sp.]